MKISTCTKGNPFIVGISHHPVQITSLRFPVLSLSPPFLIISRGDLPTDGRPYLLSPHQASLYLLPLIILLSSHPLCLLWSLQGTGRWHGGTNDAARLEAQRFAGAVMWCAPLTRGPSAWGVGGRGVVVWHLETARPLSVAPRHGYRWVCASVLEPGHDHRLFLF
jgi:hypothetical protein